MSRHARTRIHRLEARSDVAQAQSTPPTTSVLTRSQRTVHLADLDIAPENLRYGEAADDEIPQLADTIAAAGLLQFPTVRPGRRREAAFMVLDGRRRLLALRLLRDAGVLGDDHPVEVFVETDRARQAAATVLTNTAVPVHVADVVVAIGRMLKSRLTVVAIARALGYGEVEIRRLAALSALPAVALEALKTGRLTLRQARLLARLKDADEQAELAQGALDGHGLPEWRITERLDAGRTTTRDPRCGLVTPALYAAAGGRTETDLFGERPPVLLDPDRLTQAWMKRTGEVAALLESEGLTVHLSAGPSPDLAEDLERLGYAYGGALSEASATLYREARERAQAAADVLEAEGVGDDVVARLEPLIRARIAQDQAGSGERVATVVVLRPSLRIGVEVECYGPAEAEPDDDAGFEADDEAAPEIWRRSQPAYAPPRAEAPEPETEGVTHALHAVRTDVATRGLIRALADAPDVALTALTARLFSVLAVRPSIGRSESALTVTASVFSPTGGRVIEALDGAVRERLDDRRRAWEASGQALVAWVHGLAADDRLGLLAELTALSLDLREERTTLVRGSARAEAAELAALCEADVTRVWTPDAPFLQSHSKDQLLGMLAAMGASSEEVGRLKKTELVAWTADQAAERNWAPACLSWTAPPEDDAATEGAEPSGEADGPKAEPGSEGGEATACDEACDGADVEIGDDTGNETGGETGNEPGRDDDPDHGGLDGVGVFVVTPAGEAVLRNQAV